MLNIYLLLRKLLEKIMATKGARSIEADQESK